MCSFFETEVQNGAVVDKICVDSKEFEMLLPCTNSPLFCETADIKLQAVQPTAQTLLLACAPHQNLVPGLGKVASSTIGSMLIPSLHSLTSRSWRSEKRGRFETACWSSSSSSSPGELRRVLFFLSIPLHDKAGAGFLLHQSLTLEVRSCVQRGSVGVVLKVS